MRWPEDREKAHARPPGVRNIAKTAAEMRTRRKSWTLGIDEDVPRMMKSGCSSGDMAVACGRGSVYTVYSTAERGVADLSVGGRGGTLLMCGRGEKTGPLYIGRDE